MENQQDRSQDVAPFELDEEMLELICGGNAELRAIDLDQLVLETELEGSSIERLTQN
jgi:hypothetical protein